MEPGLYNADFPESLTGYQANSLLRANHHTHPVSSEGVSGSSGGKQCATWRTVNGLRLVSLGPAEDQDPLLVAVQNGNAREMMKMVTSDETPRKLTRPNADGWTLLHEAAYYGQAECLKILLAAFPDTINSRTLKGQTPLILAVSRGHITCVKHLLVDGADPSIPTLTDETPLYEACAACNAQMVLLLIKNGADVNQKYSNGWTALHESVSQNNLELCEILVKHGANVNSPNIYGVTAVFLAAQCGCVQPLQFLLKNGYAFAHIGGDINHEAKDGATALYEACKSGHEEVVEFLLSQNADVNRPGKDGLLPLHLAAKNGSYGIISKLIPVTSRTKICHSGVSPLHLAAENNKDEALELLIQSGFEVNAQLSPDQSRMYEDRHISPLYFAVENRNQEAATMLLEAGANPNLDPFKPVLLAVRQGQIKMATLLLDHGANINVSIPTHPTTFPACVMLSMKNLTMLKCLMDHGCDAAACFHCEHGSKQHPNTEANYTRAEFQSGTQIETHSCLEFCELVSSPSVGHWTGGIISLLLDYVGHVKICSRLREQLERCDAWAHIKEKSMLPRCLMQLCRLRIRQLLGRKRLKSIESLELPGRLMRYLNHDQQEDNLSTELSLTPLNNL